jgi:hypothetical protein
MKCALFACNAGLVLVLGISACSDSEKSSGGEAQHWSATTPTQIPSASFESLDALVFKPRCVSCHAGVAPAARIDLSSHEAIMSARTFPPLVFPLQSEKSLIVEVTAQGRMPIGGEKLSADTLAALKAWIDSGARKNETDPIPTPLPTPTEPPDQRSSKELRNE